MPSDTEALPVRIGLTLDRLHDGIAQALARFDVLWASAGPEVRVQGGGVTLHCRSDLSAYRAAVARAYAPADAAAAADLRIIVLTEADLGAPILRWAESFYHERAVEGVLADSDLRLHYFQPAEFWQILDRSRGVGLQIMTDATGYPAWDPGSPLRNFVQWQVAGPTRGLVHAGTLGQEGNGVLLAGPGGSGKSATVLSGVLGGLQSVGDDYVMVEDGTPPRARSLFRTMKQDPEGLTRLGLDGALIADGSRNWQGKHQFSVTDLGAGSDPGSLNLSAILLPRVSGNAQSRVTPATAKEGFLALAPTGVSQIPGDRRHAFALAARLTRALPCYHLDLGTDPDEVAATLRRIISEHGT